MAPQKAEGAAPATTCTLLECDSRSRTKNTAKLALSTLVAIVRHSTSSRSPVADETPLEIVLEMLTSPSSARNSHLLHCF